MCLVSNDSPLSIGWANKFNTKSTGDQWIAQNVTNLLDINPFCRDIATCRNDTQSQAFGSQKYLDKDDLPKRGNCEFIAYKVSNRVDNVSVAVRNMLNLWSGNETMFALCNVSIVTVPSYPLLNSNALNLVQIVQKYNVLQLILVH